MKFKACLLTCLLLVAGNAETISKKLLQEITLKLNETGCVHDRLLATTTLSNGETFVVFRPWTFPAHVNIFKICSEDKKEGNESCLCYQKKDTMNLVKTLEFDCCIESLDIIQDYVVMGLNNGKISLYNLKTNTYERAWQAHEEGKCGKSGVLVKVGKFDGKDYIISGAADWTIKAWDTNGNYKKAYPFKYPVFDIMIVPKDDEVASDIYVQGTQSYKFVKIDWNKGEQYKRPGDVFMRVIQEDIGADSSRNIPYKCPCLSTFYLKEHSFKKEHTFSEKKGDDICCIEPILGTSYLCLFFEKGMITFFDWKTEKIVGEFWFGINDNIVTRGLLPCKEKLYVAARLKNGTVIIKEIVADKEDDGEKIFEG